ncbi:SIR2 family protein [Methanosarcina mazei]|uniref:Uncharacterized protein n=1 Tax=Methanosarcina mazei SarPi TaxID=1434115 RepID=A0A0E3RAS5_METMZ|nr:SIR2 family protein [Methanosarcina mazei]AKB61379.1 hypothetical protein MSMAP_1394 [Methanosarcina mazei SarPi]
MELNANDKIVFFFGAGASVPDNAPPASELLSEALKLNNQNGEQYIDEDRINNVKRFLKEIFHDISSDDPPLPTFEEVLTPIHIATQKGEDFSDEWNLKALEKVKFDLVYCICEVLRYKLKEPKGYYNQFIDKLFDRIDPKNCTFLSSNYDILLDNALKTKTPIDYGFDIVNTRDSSDKKKASVLLKLHGSLNWNHYPNGFSERDTTEKIKIDDEKVNFDYAKIDPGHNSQYSARPLIIPPTYRKTLESEKLVKVWKKASKELESASRIFFIGYSMPDSDFHIKHLMLRSLSRTNKRPEIFVVGSKGNDTYSQSYKNYERIFGEITPLPIGFEGFIEKMNEYI